MKNLKRFCRLISCSGILFTDEGVVSYQNVFRPRSDRLTLASPPERTRKVTTWEDILNVRIGVCTLLVVVEMKSYENGLVVTESGPNDVFGG